MTAGPITVSPVTVRYAETDQMGIAHHANYLIWCELARTNHMRQQGVSYRTMEEQGVRLPVIDAQLRYRAAARYEVELEVRCWIREVSSRRVVFGYLVERPGDQRLLATATTSLIAVNSTHDVIRIPEPIRAKLVPAEDPVRF